MSVAGSTGGVEARATSATGSADSRAAARGAARVVVVGDGSLAASIARALASDGFRPTLASGTGEGGTEEGWGANLRGASLVVAALEGVTGRDVLAVDAAARAAGVPVLFVVVEGPRCVVGPLVLPRRTPCFACSRLSTVLAEAFDGAGPALVPLLPFGRWPDDAPPWVASRVADEVLHVADAILGHGPLPDRMVSLLAIDADGSTDVPFDAVTTCPACGGHHRGAVLGLDAPPPPPLARGRRDPVDATGGTRTVGPAEAEAIARRALGAVGVELSCQPLPGDAPAPLRAIACPFYRAEPALRFDVEAAVFPSFIGHSFGKGTTDAQARCSATFEWIERNFAAWRGEHDLVRATVGEARGASIDVAHLAAGLLPGLDLGKRPVDDDEPVDWVWAHCLRRPRRILVPAATVFLDTTRFLGSALELPLHGSSGLSAGCSLGDAVLQGLLEIVERDATNTAFRNGLAAPRVAPEALGDAALRALVDRIVAAGWEVHMRDVTSTIAIPTFEAYVVRPGDYTNHFASGHGAHLDPDVALRRAVTEAVQSLFYGASMGQQDPIEGTASFFKVHPHRTQAIGAVHDGPAPAHPRREPRDPWDEVDEVVARIAAAIPAADVGFVDLSHPSLEGVHVVRAFATGTMHEVRTVQVHIPERCRLVPLERLYLGPR